MPKPRPAEPRLEIILDLAATPKCPLALRGLVAWILLASAALDYLKHAC
jgi:hypothetical protein